jgi:hypothetical protein
MKPRLERTSTRVLKPWIVHNMHSRVLEEGSIVDVLEWPIPGLITVVRSGAPYYDRAHLRIREQYDS